MRWLLLVCLLLVPTMASARCGHKAKSKTTVSKAQQSCDLWSQVKTGFEITAGFRWDREVVCPRSFIPRYPVDRHQDDPAFVGLELRLPLGEYYTVHGRFDRDIFEDSEFVTAPHWNAAVSIGWAPFK